jgi:hypothetical protein
MELGISPPPTKNTQMTTSVFVVVGDPQDSNQSIPSLTRSNFKA